MSSEANGIRDVDVNLTDTGDSHVEVLFGPHHRVRIEEDGDAVNFELVATHHGFEAPANDELPTTLEDVIHAVREDNPDLTID